MIVTSSRTPALPFAAQSTPPLVTWTESVLKRFQRRPPCASIASSASSFICLCSPSSLLCGIKRPTRADEIERRLMGHGQHHAEPCLALHHASVTIGRLVKRSRFDHRANILKDAEVKSVLGIDRRAGQ